MEKKIAFFGGCLAVIHLVAVYYNLYWRWLWFDIPMHFLGGALAALVFIWFFKYFPGFQDLSRNFLLTVVLVLGFVALVGVVWEFIEFAHDLLIADKGWGRLANQGASDTIGDLFFDLVGGFLVTVIHRLKYNKH